MAKPSVAFIAFKHARVRDERVCCSPPSGRIKAKQAFKNEVDVNAIVSRFVKTGVPIPAPQAKPLYLDLASLPNNLHDALQLKARLRSVIASFSPSLQAAYNADPVGFVRSLDAHMASLAKAEKAAKEGAEKSPGKPQDGSKPVPKGDEANPAPLQAGGPAGGQRS